MGDALVYILIAEKQRLDRNFKGSQGVNVEPFSPWNIAGAADIRWMTGGGIRALLTGNGVGGDEARDGATGWDGDAW